MNDLPSGLFANPVWHALQTRHRHFALVAGKACRYPPEVAPFVAIVAPGAAAFEDLRSLMAIGESVWIIGDVYPRHPGIQYEDTLPTLQLVLPDDVDPPPSGSDSEAEIEQLSGENAGEMVALTDLAFPGFFRPRTFEMGSYYGVRVGGELVAMGGERLMLDGFSEISGVCTHPEHRGKRYAARLIWQLVDNHRSQGVVSWLHVSEWNAKAIELYLRLGFEIVHRVTPHRISRTT